MDAMDIDSSKTLRQRLKDIIINLNSNAAKNR